MPIKSKTQNNQNSNEAERNSNQRAKASRCLLRPDRGRQPPFAQEIPDTHTEMERGGQHANEKKSQVPRILHVLGDVCVRRPAVREPALRVKMPADIHKGDQSRVSLRRVEPVPYPRIRRDL